VTGEPFFEADIEHMRMTMPIAVVSAIAERP
jgi:hypothetical protein